MFNATQSPKIFSAIDPVILEAHASRVEKVVLQLLDGHTGSARLDHLEAGLYKVRLNDKHRLFIAVKSVGGGVNHLYLLHIMENHKYKLPLEIVKKLKKQIDSDTRNFRPYMLNSVAVSASHESDAIEESSRLEYERVRLLGKTLFQLSNEQNALLNDGGSLILYGEAGAGKSSTAAFLIQKLVTVLQAEDGNVNTIIYSAEAPRLVNQMQRDVAELLERTCSGEQREKVTVLFKTTQELYIEAGLRPEDFVGHQYFKKYFAKKNIQEYLQACEIPADIKEQKEHVISALYQELCLLAPWSSYESSEGTEYVTVKNSYFKIKKYPDIKVAIKNLLQSYRIYLVNSEKYDPGISLFPTPAADVKKYSYMILDEAQNITLNAVAYFTGQANDICLLTDDNQNTTAPKSSLLLKQSLLQLILKKPIPLYRLPHSFRCSPPIKRAANFILDMRDRLVDISPEEKDVCSVTQNGSAELFAVANSNENNSTIQTVLTQLSIYKKTDVAILCLEDKEAVCRLFPGYFVFYPHEVPGNEFLIGVLYHPMKRQHNNLYAAINDLLLKKEILSPVAHSVKHATRIIDTRFSRSLQELYMMLTRFIERVMVIQVKGRWNTNILNEWQQHFSTAEELARINDNADVINQVATEADWLERLLELRSSDVRDDDQIRQKVIQYLFQDLPEDQRYAAFEEIWRQQNTPMLSTSTANAVEETPKATPIIQYPQKVYEILVMLEKLDNDLCLEKDIRWIKNHCNKNNITRKFQQSIFDAICSEIFDHHKVLYAGLLFEFFNPISGQLKAGFTWETLTNQWWAIIEGKPLMYYLIQNIHGYNCVVHLIKSNHNLKENLIKVGKEAAIPLLIKLLTHEDDALNQFAFNALIQWKRDGFNFDFIGAEVKDIPALKKLLRSSSNKSMQGFVASILWGYAVYHVQHQSEKNMVIESLFALLGYNCSVKQKQEVLQLMCRILSPDGNKVEAYEKEELLVLVSLLSDPNMAIKQNAVMALFKIIANPENKVLMANVGAIQPLVKLLGDEEGAIVKYRALATLNGIMMENVDNQILVAKEEQLMVYLTALLKNPSNPMRYEAAVAVQNIFSSKDNQTLLQHNNGIIKNLVELLTDHTVEVRQAASAALGSISIDHSNHGVLRDAAGGIESLANSLHDLDRSVVENVLIVLKNIVANVENHPYLADAMAIEPVIGLLFSTSLQLDSVEVVSGMLSRNYPAVGKPSKSKAISLLKILCEDCDKELGKKAAELLWRLTPGDVSLLRFFKDSTTGDNQALPCGPGNSG